MIVSQKRERRQFVPTTHFLAGLALSLHYLAMHLKTTSAASWAGTGTVRKLRDPQVGLQPKDIVMTTF